MTYTTSRFNYGFETDLTKWLGPSLAIACFAALFLFIASQLTAYFYSFSCGGEAKTPLRRVTWGFAFGTTK